jgi:TPR repeat protein
MMLATIHLPLAEAMRHLIVLSAVLVSLGIAGAVHAGECRDLVIIGDYTRALAFCGGAAQINDPSAQYIYGVMYAEGLGVTQDNTEAVRWIRKAAAQGLAEAQYNLGLVYAVGLGVTQDVVISLMWIIVAGQQWDEIALSTRDIIERGMTPADVSKAEHLARECAEKNYKDCGF